MNIHKKIFLILSFIFLLLLSGCVNYDPPPDVVYSDNYSATNLNDLQKVFPADKNLSKQDAVTIALENNPGYKSSQLKETSAWADYYASLAALSPAVALGAGVLPNTVSNPGVLSANYQTFSGLSTTMNALSASATAETKKWDVQNYRRLLEQKVIVGDNKIQKNLADIEIQRANEKFQKQMTSKSTVEYKKGKGSLSDVLNFKIKALNAKAAKIAAAKNYKIDSYALGATMGMTDAKLPYEPKLPIKKIDRKDKEIFKLNYYLDLAIENRPDLKAQKETLKSAEYKLYGLWGAISPAVSLNSREGTTSTAVTSNITGGSKIANVRSKEAQYDAQNEALKKKWIEIVKEVRSRYISLKANLAIRDAYAASLNAARERRDHLEREFHKEKVDVVVFNQAQKTFIDVQKAFVKAEVGISNARAKLSAACGINLDESKCDS